LTLTMLKGIGRPVDIHEVDLELLGQAIDQVQSFAQSSGHIRPGHSTQPRRCPSRRLESH
jgi:hypothetical protein